MPKLPDVTAYGERAVTVDPISRTGWTGTTRTGELEGKGVAGIGDALQKLSKDIELENQKFDTVVAEDAHNKVRQKMLELTSGEKGYLNKRGEDAVNKPIMADYTKSYDDEVNNIANGLGNDRQKALLRNRASVTGLEFKSGILNHIMRERELYTDNVQKTKVQLATDIAVKNSFDPSIAEKEYETLKQPTATYMDSKGYTSKYDGKGKIIELHPVAQQYLAGIRSTMARGVIESLLANGNDQMAETYYKEGFKGKNGSPDVVPVKEYADAKDRISIEKALEMGSLLGQSQRWADSAYDRTSGDLSAMLREARTASGGNPKLRAAMMQRAVELVNTQEHAKTLDHARVWNSVMQDIESGRDVSANDMAQISKIPNANSIVDRLKVDKKNGPPRTSDYNSVMTFRDIAGDRAKLDNLTDVQFWDLALGMNRSDRQWAVDVWDAYKKSKLDDKDASIKIEDHISFEQKLFDRAETSQLIKPSRNGKTGERELNSDDKIMFNEMRSEANKRIAAWQSSKGVKHVPPDVSEGFIRDVVSEYATYYVENSGVIFDNKKKLRDFQTGERVIIKDIDSVPVDIQRDFKMQAGELGNKKLSDDKIKKAYTILLNGKKDKLPVNDIRARIYAILQDN